MFLDPPYLLNNVYNTKHIADYILHFIKDLNKCNCKIISVLGNHTLLEYFYNYFDLNIKFTTGIKFLNHNKIDVIPYIAIY